MYQTGCGLVTGEERYVGDTWTDDCNTCNCQESGIVFCTKKYCGNIPVGGTYFAFSSISQSINISFTIIAQQKFNDFPCYLGSDGSIMYVNSEANWVVGTELGVNTTVFMKYTITKATITIPNIAWLYLENDSWSQVSDLYVIPQKGKKILLTYTCTFLKLLSYRFRHIVQFQHL